MRDIEPNRVAERGAYSYPVAARFLGVSSKVVATWSNGYTRKVNYSDDTKSYAPVLQTEHARGYVTFLELIELIYCREFRRHDVKLGMIRAVAENLSVEVGPYPFASKALLIHGRSLIEKLGDGLVLDAANRQIMIDLGDHIKPNVIYSDEDRVSRLVVYGSSIILDPGVRFGEPVLASRPVPTQAIAKLYAAEGGNIESVAEYFEITEREVDDAVRFQASPQLFAA